MGLKKKETRMAIEVPAYIEGRLNDIILLTQGLKKKSEWLLPLGNPVKYHVVALHAYYVIVYYYYHV